MSDYFSIPHILFPINSSKNTTVPNPQRASPRTLTELKIYWQLLDWEKHPILIFYEEVKPQGFSQTFLDSLTRFDAKICLITDSSHPIIPTFSPQHPHPIRSITYLAARHPIRKLADKS
ncbi:NACHT C-terminal alpha/beta 1 domain-containing protein [Microcoleus sp. OTE_8_concoct_300]|uniref:NACHT C-terminal alpha/beta 1 domain-containing protein n=1 Tax=Microcoleus sp. OTE_8_concoct_300 TaxID=2964710 RepID=UPI00403FB8B5